MENSLKGLILAAGIVITCLVIGVGFYVSREAKASSANASGQINEMTGEFDEPGKILYDGIVVSGREVLEVLQKYASDQSMTITVKTLAGTSNVEYGISKTLFTGNNKADVNTYINPSGKFLGTVNRNDSDVINNITFVQQ
ncbi:MAG: hypothetical protein ACI4CT_03580 [Lachnospiraceae bacterium]